MDDIAIMARYVCRPYLATVFDRPVPATARDMAWPLVVACGVASGALSVLVFQEGLLLALGLPLGRNPLLAALLGPVPAAYRMGTDAFGLPHLLTEALRGGALGIPLAAYLCRGLRVPMLAAGALYGLGVAGGLLLVVLPMLRGLPVPGAGPRAGIPLTLLLCAAWGFGSGLLLKLLSRR